MAALFRDSMLWVHTWFGVIIGGFLFMVFWMGTLAVFDQEVDRWMMPMTRLAPLEERYSADEVWRSTGGAESEDWRLNFPTERTPAAVVEVVRQEDKSGYGYRPAVADAVIYLDPRTNEPLPDPGTLGGQGFFFPLHWNLMITSSDLGLWIVAAAGMAMLLMLTTGVIIHKKIFADFFTFRVNKKSGRVLLDLHNLVGVLGLPFHFIITISGLAIFLFVYFPTAWSMTWGGDVREFFNETRGRYARPAAGAPGEVGSLDAMIAEAERTWGEGHAAFVHVWHPHDANAYVEIRRSLEVDLPVDEKVIYFDGATGELLHYETLKPISKAQRFVAGLHFVRFRHWTLRWVYFVLGLTGCALIATGLLYWMEARRKLHRGDTPSIHLVQGLTIGSVTGVMVATLAFLIVNRVLPLELEGRARIEVLTFFAVWNATFVHGWWRRGAAWAEQGWAIAAGAVIAVLLNWATTGDHVFKTLANNNWPVAGIDLVLLASAAAAAWAALRTREVRRKVAPPAAPPAQVRETAQDA